MIKIECPGKCDNLTWKIDKSDDDFVVLVRGRKVLEEDKGMKVGFGD